MNERASLYEKIDRSVRTATTYLRKASGLLDVARHHDLPISTNYWTLLDAALEAALEVAHALPDDFFEDVPAGDSMFGSLNAFNISDGPMEMAEKVVAALQARRTTLAATRLIAKLENTTGRTPEEAAAYRAKATELRSR